MLFRFFEKYAKIMDLSQFPKESVWNLSKISQNFPTICVFLPKAVKSNALFVKFFEKYGKIMWFLLFSYEKFWTFSKILRRAGGSPWTPYEADHLKCFPPTEILAAPLLCRDDLFIVLSRIIVAPLWLYDIQII